MYSERVTLKDMLDHLFSRYNELELRIDTLVAQLNEAQYKINKLQQDVITKNEKKRKGAHPGTDKLEREEQ